MVFEKFKFSIKLSSIRISKNVFALPETIVTCSNWKPSRESLARTFPPYSALNVIKQKFNLPYDDDDDRDSDDDAGAS